MANLPPNPSRRSLLWILQTCAATCLAALPSFGQIAAWDFTGENTLATSSAEIYNANMDASNDLTRGPGAAASAGANSFRTVGFQNNGISTANTDYFQFTLSASAGFTLSLSTIDARFNGTATFANSPGVTHQFAYSTDGSTFTLIGSPVATVGNTTPLPQLDLTGVAALQNVDASTTVTLRYYASGQTTTGGWGYFSSAAGVHGLAIGGTLTPAGGGCGITLGSAVATCDGSTAGDLDTYDVSIPYTGSDAGTSVVNNGASGTVGGDNPATTPNGIITINNISEVDGYSIGFTGSCPALSASGSAPECDPPPAIVINEVDYDMVGTDNAEWIELYNAGATPVNLTGFKVELFNGSNNSVYTTITIPSGTIAANDYFVLGYSALIPNIDLVVSTASDQIQNGAPDAIGLRTAGNILLDAVSYEGTVAAPYFEGTGAAAADDNTTTGKVIARVPNGIDTQDNNADFQVWCATPGASNGGASDLDLDGVPDCIDACPLVVDGITNYSTATCTCNAGFDPVTTQIGPNTVTTACTPSSCDIVFGTAVVTCNSFTPGTTDTYTVSIPYTGSEPGVTVVNNSGSGTIGGDDPATFVNGTIVVSGISEANAYSITLSAPCTAQISAGAAPNCEPTPALVINEVDYDQPATDGTEFIEIKNTGASPVALGGLQLILWNGATNLSYATITLNAVTLAVGDYYVVGSSGVPNVDQIAFTTNGIQNGDPDGIRLTMASGTIIDQMAYGAGTISTVEGSNATTDLAVAGVSIARIPDGSDTQDNSVDFVRHCFTPGTANIVVDSDFDGTPDCFDLCPGGPEPGTACDDEDENTGSDVIQSNCECHGIPVDCEGVPGGTALPGTLCDDGDIATVDDEWTAECECEGTLVDCLGIPGGPALPGTPCTDGNPNTVFDTWQEGCACVGQACTINLTLEFQTDDDGDEISWEIRQQGTNLLVQSGPFGPHPDNATVTDFTCLINGCYYLRVLDAGGDGITNGGYILRTSGSPGTRIIDNRRNFSSGGVSQIAGGEGFCLPLGVTSCIYTSCDKLDWVTGEYVVCSAVPAVSALWNAGNTPAEATTGYEFQIVNPNGGYIFNRFRSHSVSDGFAPDNASRACHMKLNNWAAAQHVPANVLMNVRIRTRINGVNGNWGAACRLKVDPVRAACPLTKLMDIPGNANVSCNSIRQWGTGNYVHARPVTGATQYQWRFRIDAEGFLAIRTTTTYFIQLNWITLPLQDGKTYQVEVRAFKGGAWCIDTSTPTPGPNFMQWGDVCDLTIGNDPMNGEESFLGAGRSERGEEPSLYPNPNRGDQLVLSLDAIAEDVKTVNVGIFDATGRRMMERTFAVNDHAINTTLDLGGTMTNGLYFVSITAGEQCYTERLVIQR